MFSFSVEAKSGTVIKHGIERDGIDHPDEEENRLSVEKIATVGGVEIAGWPRGNDNVTGSLEDVTTHAFATEYANSTKDTFVTTEEGHFENTSKKYTGDQGTMFASWRIEHSEEQAEEATLRTNVLRGRETNESAIEKPKSDWLMVMSAEKKENVIDVKYDEQRNVEDIRAISFQVPPPDEERGEDYQDNRQGGKPSVSFHQLDETRRFVETRKNQSRPTNNLLLTGKSTKAFYEIKPSIRTLETPERGRDHQLQPTTHRTLSGRRFVLPTVDSAIGKFGPYFEDGNQETNVTARIGSTVLLDCKIGMLGDKKVSVAPLIYVHLFLSRSLKFFLPDG